MTIFKVIIDGKETGETLIASSYEDAYFDVASTSILTYDTIVELVPVGSGETMTTQPDPE
jgi:ABC-type siderophore export system fused ATPase/permease subunit